jgi:hypothetical protein
MLPKLDSSKNRNDLARKVKKHKTRSDSQGFSIGNLASGDALTAAYRGAGGIHSGFGAIQIPLGFTLAAASGQSN